MRLTIVPFLAALGLTILPGLGATRGAGSAAPAHSQPPVRQALPQSALPRLQALTSASQVSRTAPSAAPMRLEMAAHQQGVDSVAFSPDGKVLASGGGDGKLVLESAAGGRIHHT